MFLHLCVILFTEGEGVASQHASQVTWPKGGSACRQGGLHPEGSACRQGLPRGEGLHLGVSMQGVSMQGGWVCIQGGRVCMQGSLHAGGGLHPGGWTDSPSTTGYGQQAGGTHFTGMHSCLCDLITYDINSTLTLIWSYHPSSIGSFRASRNISPVESMILPLQQKDAVRKERQIKQ